MCWGLRFTRCGSRYTGLLLSGGAVLLLVVWVGCDTMQPARSSDMAGEQAGLPPVLRRMQQVYPELASGRFVSLADFESRAQVALFRTIGADGVEGDRPQPGLSILRSRNETGAASLKGRLESADDRLLFDGKNSRELALIRDWTPYHLLMMSVYGSDDGATLELEISSGKHTPLSWTHTLHVRPGWNLVRLDVGTIGESIDLSNVRRLAWRAPEAYDAVEFYLDDLILTDNTRAIVPRTDDEDALYVLRRGRRIVVGAPGRFELALADGVIVSWRGPHRQNLADPGGLGPWPVPLAANWNAQPGVPVAYDDPALFVDWGNTVATMQKLVEATTFRAVVEGQWRYVDLASGSEDPGADLATRPGHSWRYVIYPFGRVHVRIESTAPEGGWPGPRVGYAIGLAGRSEFSIFTPAAAGTARTRPDYLVAAREAESRADLLWTWPRNRGLTRFRELTTPDGRRLAIVAGDVGVDEAAATVHLLRVWPTDMDDVQVAEALAADYQNTAVITASTGRSVTDAVGDDDQDGYNESDGCYELATDGRALRFDFNPEGRLRFDTLLRVRGTAGTRCWAYARGRRLTDLGRDLDEALLVYLGRVTSTPTTIELHTLETTPAAP